MNEDRARLTQLLEELRNLRIEETTRIHEIEQIAARTTNDETSRTTEARGRTKEQTNKRTETRTDAWYKEIQRRLKEARTDATYELVRNNPHTWRQGDDIYIQNRITIPKEERQKRTANENDRHARIRGIEIIQGEVYRVYIKTRNCQKTWRLPKNLLWLGRRYEYDRPHYRQCNTDGNESEPRPW